MINGVVRTNAPAGVTAQVVGTSLSARLDAAGSFLLQSVPAGTRQVRFTGPAVDAAVAIADVQAGETITIAVTANGSSASIDSVSRSQSAEARASIELQGTAQGVAGTAAGFQFTVDGKLVKGDGTTVFGGDSHSRTFADLKNGVRVEVKGQQRDGFIFADRIQVEDPNDDDDNDDDNPGENPGPNNPPNTPNPTPRPDPSAEFEGVLTSIGGQMPQLTLLVGGTTVKTSASTEVRRRGDLLTLDALKVNQRLEVEGTRNTDNSIAARKITIEDDANPEPEPDERDDVEVQGTIGGLQGTCPSITFSVNAASIATDRSTEFKDAACTALRNGDRVEVKGSRQGSGTLLATRVEKKKS